MVTDLKSSPMTIPELKAIVLPSKEVMREQLKEINVLGVSPEADKFYERYIEIIADSQKNGMGLAISWEIAQHNALLSGCSPMLSAIVDLDFITVVKTIAPDIAEYAIKFRNEAALRGSIKQLLHEASGEPKSEHKRSKKEPS